jgi:hypothetical protein
MPVEIIGEAVFAVIEVAANVGASSDVGDKKGCGCLALIFVIATIAVITYCLIKY